MREIALAMLTVAGLAVILAAAIGLGKARSPDGAYRAAILGALGIGGLLGVLLKALV